MLSIICMYLFYVWGSSFAGFANIGGANSKHACTLLREIALRKLVNNLILNYIPVGPP